MARDSGLIIVTVAEFNVPMLVASPALEHRADPETVRPVGLASCRRRS